MQPTLLFLDTGSGRRLVSVDAERMAFGPRPPCAANPRHVLPVAVLSPLSVVLRSRPRDLFVTDGLDRLVTERVRQLFVDEGITGWRAEPVAARYADAAPTTLGQPPGLWRLVTTGWGGVAPESSGLLRVEGPGPGCGKQLYRGTLDLDRLFDAGQWDGSDVFMIWPFPNYVWVTPRVAELVRREKLRGARLLTFADPETRALTAGAELGVGVWGLSRYLPAEQARTISASAGLG